MQRNQIMIGDCAILCLLDGKPDLHRTKQCNLKSVIFHRSWKPNKLSNKISDMMYPAIAMKNNNKMLSLAFCINLNLLHI